jgi:hypothetical protein
VRFRDRLLAHRRRHFRHLWSVEPFDSTLNDIVVRFVPVRFIPVRFIPMRFIPMQFIPMWSRKFRAQMAVRRAGYRLRRSAETARGRAGKWQQAPQAGAQNFRHPIQFGVDLLHSRLPVQAIDHGPENRQHAGQDDGMPDLQTPAKRFDHDVQDSSSMMYP